MDKWLEKENMMCVTIYADTTRQFTDEEIESLQNSFWGQMLDIPVPKDLMWQWYKSNEPKATMDEFRTWFYEESTADDCDSLYDWLVAHGYQWKRFNIDINTNTNDK